MFKSGFFALSLFLASNAILSAHDSWVEVNTPEVAAGQPVYAALMLGNHGNHHRDFKLASKIPLKGSTLVLIAPDGGRTNLKRRLFDEGLEEKEGYWSARLFPGAPGLYCIAHTYDAVVSYAPKRALKSGKTYFACGTGAAPFTARALGHPLEIIPLRDPTRLHAGDALPVRVLLRGKPLAGAVISAIPKGATLTGEFDPAHEAKTDARGDAVLPLKEANRYLVATHYKAPEETGKDYQEGTEYGATLTVMVQGR